MLSMDRQAWAIERSRGEPLTHFLDLILKR